MQNILLLLARYGAHLLFIGLEIFCFYLIVNYNKNQKDIFLNSSLLFAGKMDEKVDNARDYFYLEEVNDSLQQENAKLIQKIANIRRSIPVEEMIDSLIYQFEVIPATISSKTINKRNNYFTISAGKRDGVQSGMGVITGQGVVGVVRTVSSQYAVVLPLINSLARTSCLIKNKRFSGILSWPWENQSPLIMTLEDVPKHANISIGDTIITSGYSTIYPKGIEIGTIRNFTAENGSATYEIDVNLWEDLSKIEYVYIIKNHHKAQLDSLRNIMGDE